MFTLLKSLFFLLLSISLFSACGESSSYQATSTKSASLKGSVAHGYIRDTSVCLDLDYSNNCGANEPVSTTNVNGDYSFSNIKVTEKSLVPVLASSKRARLRTIVEISPDEDLKDIIISPLTDLTATYFLSTNEKNSLDLIDAKNIVGSNLNISQYQLEKDPLNSRTLFIASQKVYYMATLLKTLVHKNMSVSDLQYDAVEIENIIKEILLQNSAEITSILASLEATFGISIPENEKVYIEAQMQEMYTSLSSIPFTNTIEELQAIQKDIAQQLITVNERLKVIDGDYVVEVIPFKNFSH